MNLIDYKVFNFLFKAHLAILVLSLLPLITMHTGLDMFNALIFIP